MEKPYRHCVRIVIIKGDKILLGDKIIGGKFVGHEFPGGGVEGKDSYEETVEKECLEEVGLVVNHIRPLGLVFSFGPNFLSKERQKIFKGGVDTWYLCEYVKKDESLLNIEGDKLKHQWVTPQEAIKLIEKTPPSDYNPPRLTALQFLTKDLNTQDKRGYRPTVRVVIRKGNQVLLCTKKYDDGNTYYVFPGGGIELGESTEEAAYKECLEEVGVRTKNIQRLGLEYRNEVSFINKKERAKEYRGNLDSWCVADYDGEDTRLLNKEGDSMPYQWTDIPTAIETIKTGPHSKFNICGLEALQAVAKLNGNRVSIEQRNLKLFSVKNNQLRYKLGSW